MGVLSSSKDHVDWEKSSLAWESQMLRPSSKENISHENYSLISLTYVPGKMWEWVLLKDISGHVREGAVIRSSGVDWPRVDHAWPSWLFSVIKLPGLQTVGEQWMLVSLTPASFWHFVLLIFLYPTGTLQSEREDKQMGKKLLEWLGSEVMVNRSCAVWRPVSRGFGEVCPGTCCVQYLLVTLRREQKALA